MSTFKRVKVVMLPSEKATKLWLNGRKQLNYGAEAMSSTNNIGNHLYIISNDEIKEGDWYCYNTIKGNQIKQYFEKEHFSEEHVISLGNLSGKKIIATTDESLSLNVAGKLDLGTLALPQPSQSFIEKYIEQYNKGNIITDIMVEYVDNGEEDWIGDNHNGEPFWNEKIELKINPKDNTITIKSIKNSWNKDEVIELIHTSCDDCCFNPMLLDKWIEDNL